MGDVQEVSTLTSETLFVKWCTFANVHKKTSNRSQHLRLRFWTPHRGVYFCVLIGQRVTCKPFLSTAA